MEPSPTGTCIPAPFTESGFSGQIADYRARVLSKDGAEDDAGEFWDQGVNLYKDSSRAGAIGERWSRS